MSEGCRVCWRWHQDAATEDECGHWCHFVGAEDWDTSAQRGGDGQEATDG